MHFLIIGLIILLSSCSNPYLGNYYSQTVESWHGGNAKALVARWGAPDKEIISNDGNKFFIYKSNSYRTANTTTAQLGLNFRDDGKPVIVSTPNPSWSRGALATNCMTAFETNKKGTIVSTQMGGNGCYGNASFAETRGNPKKLA